MIVPYVSGVVTGLLPLGRSGLKHATKHFSVNYTGLLPLRRSGLKCKHYLFACINAKSIYHDWNADYYYGVVYTGQGNKASE